MLMRLGGRMPAQEAKGLAGCYASFFMPILFSATFHGNKFSICSSVFALGNSVKTLFKYA